MVGVSLEGVARPQDRGLIERTRDQLQADRKTSDVAARDRERGKPGQDHAHEQSGHHGGPAEQQSQQDD